MFSAIFSAASGASLGTLFVRMTADATDLVRGLNQATTSIESSCATILAQVKNLALGVTAALVVIGAVAVREAMKFEDSFAGVRKTVDATELEFEQLEQQFRDLAKTIPVNVNEINKIAEIGGQVGIAKENLAEFTKIVSMLGTTTNLVGEEAATSMARVANVTGVSQKEFDKLGSTIVALGRDGAATEKEIVDMALRIGGAGKTIGLTAQETLALANALSSVGIQAEMGGSAISQTMIQMSKAVTNGGESLEMFANVAGMTANQFTAKFRTDASGAVLDFIKGLGAMQEAGANVFNVLEGLGIDGIRMTDMLLRASNASDIFTKSLEVGSKAWEENSALTDAAQQRYNTFSSQLTITWNLVKDLLISIGQELVPVLKAFNMILQDVVRSMEDENSATRVFIKELGPALVAILGLVGDAIWGWKLILKNAEFSFNMFAAAITGVFGAIVTNVHVAMETVANTVIEGINKAIRAMNVLLPAAKEFKEIQRITIDSTNGAAKASEEFLEKAGDAYAELEDMVNQGSFSDRLQENYKKVTKVVVDSNKEMVASTKQTAVELSQMDKDSAFALQMMAGMKTPDQDLSNTKGLRYMEDPRIGQLHALSNELMLAQENLKQLQELEKMELQLTEEVQTKKLAMMEAYNEKVKTLQLAQAGIVVSAATDMFSSLAIIAAGTAGKQSGIYKTMFAMSKAFAIADATVKIAQGIAAASANPFPYNLVAMASVAAATASIVSNIQATQMEFAGARAEGGPVSGSQAYLVGERGPELMVPSGKGTIIPNDRLGGSDVKVVINNYTDAQATVTERNDGGERVLEVMIKRTKTEIASEIRDGRGDVSKSMESTYGLRRGKT